jgi:hypothetical protein
MEYQLTIMKQERNPKWSPMRDPYSGRAEEPEWLVYNTALTVLLNEEEFVAIKKAVIEVIK